MNAEFSKQLIDNLSDGIIVADETGRIIYQNAAVLAITGYPAEVLQNNNITTLIPDRSKRGGMHFFTDLVKGKRTLQQVNLKARHYLGHNIWIEASFSNLINNPAVNVVIVNFRNVSVRLKSVEQQGKSEAKLQTILQNAKTAYVLLDSDLSVLSFNQLAKDRYLREIGVVLGENYNFRRYLEENNKEGLEDFQRVLKGQVLNYETSFVQADGAVCWYAVEMFPVRTHENESPGFIISSEDITERKMTELEREKMTNDLVHHNKDLEQFGYIVSHNLRSPVSNIRGLISILQDKSVISESDFQRCLAGLSESAIKLDSVITDLNYILQTRREVDESREAVDFEKLLSTVKTGLGDQIYRSGAKIVADFEVKSIFSLKTYLHSIFVNLIANSLKYRRPDVDPIISISTRKVGERTVIKISDNGLGIDLEKHGSKLFGLYKKFHLHVEGKGMGLYMVKTQVGILDGTIQVESTLHKGTCFIIDL